MEYSIISELMQLKSLFIASPASIALVLIAKMLFNYLRSRDARPKETKSESTFSKDCVSGLAIQLTEIFDHRYVTYMSLTEQFKVLNHDVRAEINKLSEEILGEVREATKEVASFKASLAGVDKLVDLAMQTIMTHVTSSESK